MLGWEESITFRCVLFWQFPPKSDKAHENVHSIYAATLTMIQGTARQTDSTITKSEPRVQSLGVNHLCGHRTPEKWANSIPKAHKHL
jgi:hypothetical protein